MSEHVISADPIGRENSSVEERNKQKLFQPIGSALDHVIRRHVLRPKAGEINKSFLGRCLFHPAIKHITGVDGISPSKKYDTKINVVYHTISWLFEKAIKHLWTSEIVWIPNSAAVRFHWVIDMIIFIVWSEGVHSQNWVSNLVEGIAKQVKV